MLFLFKNIEPCKYYTHNVFKFGVIVKYKRMPIEIESPEQLGYNTIAYNLSESSYTDQHFKSLNVDLKNLVICYGDHIGHQGLRSEIIKNEESLKIEDVLITPGAAAALFFIATSLLEKDDKLVVVNPNYATNIETPKTIGACIKYVNLNFEQGYKLDLEKLKKEIDLSTKLVSITYPHNPTGVMISLSELEEIIKRVEEANTYLLVDETYRDMTFKDKLPVAATLSDRVISVSSVSKTYGLPGIRTGWIICKNKKLMETFLAAKEQIVICGSVVDEEIAYLYLKHSNNYFPSIKEDIQKKFVLVKEWFKNQKYFEWIEPHGGVVCFPRIKKEFNVDLNLFYETLLKEYKTYVGPGHWFDQDRRYFRLGFGWPSIDDLRNGLIGLNKTMESLDK